MISVVQSEWGLAHLDVGEVFFKEIPKSLSKFMSGQWNDKIVKQSGSEKDV